MSRAGVFITLAIVLSMVVIFMAPMADAQSNTPNVRMHLSGPEVLGTLRSGTYSATFIDPDNRNWEYKVFVTATDSTGAFPRADSPLTGNFTSENGTFTFEVTATQAVGEMNIHVNCTSGTQYYEKVQRIFVVSPIAIKAEVYNPSNVEIKNATATFYIDGVEIDTQVILSMGAMQTTAVSSEWISRNKKPGWHTSKIVIDLNGDGVIDTHAGDIVIEERFYIEGENNWVFAVTVLAGLTALILGLGYISKRKIK